MFKKNIIDHIKLKPLGSINDLNINKFCHSNQQSKISINNNDSKETILQNSFLDTFASKNDFINVQNNDTNENIYSQQQIVNSLNFIIN